MKAQSSVEFLMNYSWMFAIVGIVMGVLFVLGFFNQNTWGLGAGSAGFGNLKPIDNGWKLDSDGIFLINLQNNAGSDLKLWSIKAKIGEKTNSYNYAGHTVAAGNDTGIIVIGGFDKLSDNTAYNAIVTLSYGTSDINFTSEGKVWGNSGR
jgi:hypothetical protein